MVDEYDNFIFRCLFERSKEVNSMVEPSETVFRKYGSFCKFYRVTIFIGFDIKLFVRLFFLEQSEKDHRSSEYGLGKQCRLCELAAVTQSRLIR